MNFKLEVIGFSVEGCIAAQAAGANRIELCDNPSEGGTTPSYGFIKIARELLQVEMYVMIRPRGGDFIYSDREFEIMKHDIQLCKQLNCEGIVLGILDRERNVDKKRTEALVSLAYPMGVTFHRAFDRAKDPMQALKDIIDTGCERILTSGQMPTAFEGMQLIKQLIDNSANLIIMPGSGIRSENILSIARNTHATEFHTSARITRKTLQYPSPGMVEDLDPITVDEMEINKIISCLKEYSPEELKVQR